MTTPRTSPATSRFTPPQRSVRGRFLWHELLVPSAEPALAFYSDVASWTHTSMALAEGLPPYHELVNGTGPVAGVMPYPPGAHAMGMPRKWLPYMGTDDIDATHTLAIAMGSVSHMSPTEIPSVGFVAALTDPFGAAFALFAPLAETPPEAKPRDGEFSWHDLETSDPGDAFDFYAELFGWERGRAMDMGADGVYQMFGRDGFTYGGIVSRGAKPASAWTCYIQVHSLGRSCDAVRRHGGAIDFGPHEVPGGDRIVMCRDNQGAAFALHGKAV